MPNTTNLNLIKPEKYDEYSIVDINTNMDTIDTEVFGLKKSILQSSGSSSNSITTFLPNGDIMKVDANFKLITKFQPDGSILEELRNKEDNNIISTKKTIFRSDGSIEEVIT